MSDLRFTLVSDGPGDRALVPVLQWVLTQQTARVFAAEWPDLRRLRVPPRALNDRITKAVELAPCDLLFVHRDAEGGEPGVRHQEIGAAVRASGVALAVPVVPVRMTEAWLLWNEAAIRLAAGNPRGQSALGLPSPGEVERRVNPKADLRAAIQEASGLGARRRATVRPVLNRIAEAIGDYSPLRAAPAFARLESDVRRVARQQGW